MLATALAVTLAGTACWVAYKRQITTLDQSHVRLNEAELQIKQGNLNACGSLLFQVRADVRGSDGWYWPKSVNARAAVVKERCEQIQTNLTTSAEFVRKVVGTVGTALAKGDYETARQAVREAQAEARQPQATIGAIGKYVERLAVQDFQGAGSALETVAAGQPDPNRSTSFRAVLAPVLEQARTANLTSQQEIATAVRGLVDRGSAAQISNPILRGRAMVWDFTKGNIEPAYQMLPDELRGSSRDGVITMFCIRERKNVEVGRYNISGQPAYREEMKIAVVYWPARQLAGLTSLSGTPPPASRRVQYSPGYGSSASIRDWIAKLPRDSSGAADGSIGVETVSADGTSPIASRSGSASKAAAGINGTPAHLPSTGNQSLSVRETVEQIRSGTHEALPAFLGTRNIMAPQFAVLVLSNSTDDLIAIYFTGPEHRSIQLPSGGRRTLSLGPGQYEIGVIRRRTGSAPLYGSHMLVAGMSYSGTLSP